MAKISKEIKVIKKLKKFIYENNLDGYIIPKNDKFFTEYSNTSILSIVTNFTGSAGFAIILREINYLFVDGRYTLQAEKQSGKEFKVIEIPHRFPKNLAKIHNSKIGFDPKLFTEKTLNNYFEDTAFLIPVEFNFRIKSRKKIRKIFHLNKSITGENSSTKINRVVKYMSENKIDYLFGSVFKDRLMHGFFPNKIWYKFNVFPSHSCGFFVKKSVHHKLGLYDTKFKYSSDRDFIYRLINSKFNGISAKKYQIFGNFSPNGISSKLSYSEDLIESFRVRLKNQNLFIVIFVLFLTIANKIKNILFKK